MELTTTKYDKWEISPKQINFFKKIGEGAFGSVFFATVDKDADVIMAYNAKYNNGVMENKFAVKTLIGKINSIYGQDLYLLYISSLIN